eukprot:Platyproteum_vivax@DN7492_c0_g1_i2.p1
MTAEVEIAAQSVKIKELEDINSATVSTAQRKVSFTSVAERLAMSCEEIENLNGVVKGLRLEKLLEKEDVLSPLNGLSSCDVIVSVGDEMIDRVGSGTGDVWNREIVERAAISAEEITTLHAMLVESLKVSNKRVDDRTSEWIEKVIPSEELVETDVDTHQNVISDTMMVLPEDSTTTPNVVKPHDLMNKVENISGLKVSNQVENIEELEAVEENEKTKSENQLPFQTAILKHSENWLEETISMCAEEIEELKRQLVQKGATIIALETKIHGEGKNNVVCLVHIEGNH